MWCVCVGGGGGTKTKKNKGLSIREKYMKSKSPIRQLYFSSIFEKCNPLCGYSPHRAVAQYSREKLDDEWPSELWAKLWHQGINGAATECRKYGLDLDMTA